MSNFLVTGTSPDDPRDYDEDEYPDNDFDDEPEEDWEDEDNYLVIPNFNVRNGNQCHDAIRHN